MPPSNANESYCTFTLASDVTAGGLPSEEDIARDLESKDTGVGWKREIRTLEATMDQTHFVPFFVLIF